MREELPDALDNRRLVLQRPQQSHSKDYLQSRSPVDERSQKERHDQDHDDLILDIDFSFLTASEVALPRVEQQSPRKSGCFEETEVSLV
jgi:hypothetical protein